jgi:hypothetical protein
MVEATSKIKELKVSLKHAQIVINFAPKPGQMYAKRNTP